MYVNPTTTTMVTTAQPGRDLTKPLRTTKLIPPPTSKNSKQSTHLKKKKQSPDLITNITDTFNKMTEKHSCININIQTTIQTGEDEFTNNTLAPISDGSANNHMGSVIITICIEARYLHVLADSGASITLISERMALILELQMEPLRTAISLNTANKSKLEILGSTQITLTIGTQVKVVRTVIARNLAHDMILGTDFLRKHKCCIEFENDTIRVGGLNDFHEWIPIEGSRLTNQSINSIDNKPGDIVNINKDLTESEKEQIKKLINEYQDVFSKGPEDIGESSFVHKIELTSVVPVKKKSYRTAEAHKKVVEEELTKMLRMEVVQKSQSPYGAPVVLIKKKDNSVRFCVDFRGLNEVTVKDNFPMPYIDEELEGFLGKRYFTTIDLTSGYWQFLVEDSAKKYTAFTTHKGSFEFNRMPFGLCNAGATFQRAMQELLDGLEYARSFIDDIIISSETFEEHLVHIREVLEKLREAKRKAKPSKCNKVDFEIKKLTC